MAEQDNVFVLTAQRVGHVGGETGIAVGRRVGRAAVAAQVGRHPASRPAALDERQHPAPHRRIAADAVQQDQQRPAAAAGFDMDLDGVHGIVASGGSFRSARPRQRAITETGYVIGERRSVAEGGGIEPPTPYRVYGLAIRCITALPSLRYLLAPGRRAAGPEPRPGCRPDARRPIRVGRGAAF